MSKRLCLPLELLWKETHKTIVEAYRQKLRDLAAKRTAIQVWRRKKGDDSETSGMRVAFSTLRFSPP
jgi:hypothetical protein